MIFGAHGLCVELTEKEEKTMKMKRMAIACAVALGSGGMVFTHSALAQSTDELKQQVESMQKQIDSLKNRVDQQQTQPVAAAPAPASPASTGGHEFLERKPGDGFTLFTHGGELSVYGVMDVSVDTSTKGIGDVPLFGASPPVGNTGWMPDISSNLSYVGVRGFQTLGDSPTHFVYQLETQIDISNTPGTANTNSNNSDQVKGALVSRNSFIGLADVNGWGALKIGKTDAPYKNSTARMNAFSGMWGDYSVIMGNTGGDNRVEFGTRLAHALWYESPKMGGFNFNVLASPGQNRATDDSNIPAGEPDCAGGNIPTSGQPSGSTVNSCNDGSFGNAYSADVSYETGGLYLTAAYEMDRKVNRTGDTGGNPLDVADEYAEKGGIQYRFSTGTTISVIYESLHRNVDPSLSDQNERQRKGSWLALSQQ